MLTSAFLEDVLKDCLDSNSSRLRADLHIDHPDDPKRKQIRGAVGEIIVHKLPSSSS